MRTPRHRGQLLFARRDAGRIIIERLRPARLKRTLKRWLVRDRPWIGRLAQRLGTVVLEGCVFRIDSPLISDALKCRLLYGRYERTERQLLRKHLHPNSFVIELGGGMGVVACIVNRHLHDKRRHVVVEPNHVILPLLQRNRDSNAAEFDIVHAAIGYTAKCAALIPGEDLLGSRTVVNPHADVPVTQLEKILETHPCEPCTLICDIEGSEIDLVAQEIGTLQSRVAVIVIEEHPEYCSPERRAGMFRRLQDAGFIRIESLRKVHVLKNARLS